jgi:hypothetical protein
VGYVQRYCILVADAKLLKWPSWGGYLVPAAPLACVYNPLQLPLVFILITGGSAPNLKAKLLGFPSNFNIPY